MNLPAFELFKRHGIDLGREPLEVAVCAQHNNGGFKGTVWWESNVRHLFPVGEACGTHGVRRPGGAALNSGQVGSARAARFIAARYRAKPPSAAGFVRLAGPAVGKEFEFARGLVGKKAGSGDLVREALAEIRRRMSACGAQVRPPADVARETPAAWALVERLRRELRVPSARALPAAFGVLGMALTHAVYLEAIREYLDRGGKSRGSYLVPDPAGRLPCPGLEGRWAFSLAAPGDFTSGKVLEVGLDGAGRAVKKWVDVRPVPADDGWFETVWKGFLEDGNIREEE